ncbi:MAG: serine hydrolase [Kibdelosporangium sp.]
MTRRLLAALFTALCLVLIASVPATAQQPETACPNKTTPPPPVDTSENPKPGQQPPAALAVPDKPAGGPRMAECGVIAPSGAAAPPADVTPASWVLADLDSGEVLGAKDPHARQRPASLIKVLLAIVVLNELDMNTVVTGTQEDANQDGTRVGIGPGGQYTVKQLFFSLLMKSGNDCAHALAMQLGGVQQTLDKMNVTAKKLGALDTRAATPSGLDGPGMTSSAYDLVLLYREAMKRPEFAEAIATRQIDLPGYGTKPGFKVNNDNRLLGTFPGFLGGKTGFTDDARHTYLGGAKQGDRKLVVVLLRGEQTPVKLADQGAKLFKWGAGLAKGAQVGSLDTLPEPTKVPPPTTFTVGPGGSAIVTLPNNGSGALPLIAMSVSAVTVLGFLIWRVRRRFAQPPGLVRPDQPDPDQTRQLPRLRD